jgi:hypothetical protein
MLPTFLLVAFLLTFENGGVHCFANGLHNLRPSTGSKANANANYLSTTRRNTNINEWAGGSAQNGPSASPFGRRQSTVQVQRRMTSNYVSSSSEDENVDNQKEILSLRGGDSAVVPTKELVKAWPCGDALDKS